MLHIMLMALIKVIMSVKQLTDEKVMYHFIKEHPLLGEVRVVTNFPTESERLLYHKSVTQKSPVDGLYAINNGQYVHAMLRERLTNKGIPFRLNVIQNGVINPEDPTDPREMALFLERMETLVGKSNFAYANARTTSFLQFLGRDDWGLEPMGIEVIDAPKSASKRCNEISRSTRLFHYTEDLNSVRVKVADQRDLAKKARDGMSYISKSFALMMAQDEEMYEDIRQGRIKRLNFRFSFPANFIPEMPSGGQIKGDVKIRPDHALKGYHIVAVPENLKPEVRLTQSFVMATGFFHHPTYDPTWDSQRTVNNPQILTSEHRMRDLKSLVARAKATLEEETLPEWILAQGEDSYEEEGGSVREVFKDQHRSIIRWQEAGFSPWSAQNEVRMVYSAIINRMGAFFDKVERGNAIGYAKTMWLPKSNAMVALINSHSSLTKIGGYKTHHSGDKSYFVNGYGYVINDQRVVDVFDLSGGWDFDDSSEGNLVRIWSSDDNVTQMMRDNGVIGQGEGIPSSADEAKYTVAFLRAPNGCGEYSFIEFEDVLGMPWCNLDLSTVEVIDLVDLPLPQGEMLKSVSMGGLTPSITYSGQQITREDALRQIVAQQFNPQVGQVANAMMVWAAVNGPSLPPRIAGPFEQLVDGVQQLSDPQIFAAVVNTAEMVNNDAIDALKCGATIDRYLVPRFAGTKRRKIALTHSVEGPMYKFQEAYREAIKELYTETQQKTLQMRDREPIVQWVRQLNYNSDAYLWAKQFHIKHAVALAQIEQEFDFIKEMKLKGIAKMSAQRDKSLRTKEIIDAAVAELRSFDNPGKRALAVWYYILTPTGREPMGSGDRLIFQMGTTESIMDILIPELHARGWGNPGS